MNTVTMVLSALLTVAMVMMMLPSVIAMNRGKALRNFAAWLAIVAVLGLAYKNFGPGREIAPVPGAPAMPAAEQNFTPPKE